MLLMFEKGIWGRIYHAIHRFAKVNDKYMTNYEINNIWSYLEYLDASNLYGWETSQKLPVNGFKYVRNLFRFDEHRCCSTEDSIKSYDENNKEYILEGDIEYPKNLFNLHKDLSFLAEKKIEKWKELVCSLHDEENYGVHIRALKQASNYELILKKYTE